MAGKVTSFLRRAEALGQEVRRFRKVERLMPLAYELALSEPRTAHGRILIAEEITAARGRHGRTWVAKRGGLWMALSLYDDHLPQSRGLFPLIFGLALGRMAEELGIPSRVRWINDLHFRGRKIAGVLIERRNPWLIVGLGLNVNNPPPPGLPAASLKDLTGKPFALETVFETLKKYLRYYYAQLQALEAELRPYEEVPQNLLIEDFKRLSDTLGRCVAWALDLDQADQPVIGKVQSILGDGSLLLSTSEGNLTVDTGEIIYLL